MSEGMMSLADIAGMDTSDITELRSSQLPTGLFLFEVGRGSLSEKVIRDDEQVYEIGLPLKIVEVDTITEKDTSPEDVIGKTHNERWLVIPAEAEKGIGYAKAFVADIGGDNTGAMGGVEDSEGWLTKNEGLRFLAKVVKKKGKDGEWYSRIQLPKPGKKS